MTQTDKIVRIVNQNRVNQNRVSTRVAPVIIAFAKSRIPTAPEFHVEELRTFVYDRLQVAPASPDRILRMLKKRGDLNYTVVSRPKSLYRIESVSPFATAIYADLRLPTDRAADAKNLIDTIVAFINVHDEASKSVWDILTALRGPDTGDGKLKEETTARLRHAVGLSMISTWNSVGFITNSSPMRLPDQYCSFLDHFEYHYKQAYHTAEKLGFKVK